MTQPAATALNRLGFVNATSTVYRVFLTQLLRNYVFGSMIAVLGVGSTLVFSTLQISWEETVRLAVILVASLILMLMCELYVFRLHLKPIQAVFRSGVTPTSDELKTAYLRTHHFPVLSVKRIFGPHFLGMSIPAAAMTSWQIIVGDVGFPLYYVGLAVLAAFLVASMHALIEFFLTSKSIQPIVVHIRETHVRLYQSDLTLSGEVIVSINRKFLFSAFLIGTLPLVLFSLAAQIRLTGLTGEDTVAYWKWAAIILVIGVLFSILSAKLMSADIRQPIQTIHEAMSLVKEGNFTIRTADTYSDEFSRLAAGFNHMVEGLREREERNNQLLQSYFFTLAAALDARDPYTAGHSERVAQYAVRIGELAGLGKDDVETIRKSALLHDIGKIGVRDAVLLKDGKLTDEEFDQIKQHPVQGENILRRIEPADAMAALLPGVRSHHERYDGRGYPDGLAGDAIPLLGKIIAIADAYDAMTSDRPYRKGMDRAKALSILEGGKGEQWDPLYTELFIRSFD
ncbi:HD-GYP domain-containing protein [Paenibacillus sp. GCM10023252]|uniref:HD-GYP domain-containing protein n=1 Tax=Paenibacillus sp. GCM10023252 TaxID=3252649 RepID=UPI00361A481C